MSTTAAEEAELLASLPPYSVLQIWVYRPQAVAKCTVGDVFGVRALVSSVGGIPARSNEVYVLHRYPCRMVEVVGWVASVDDKLDKLFITLDDGDGQHLISITLRLQPHTPSTSTHTAQPPVLRPSTPPPPPKAPSTSTFLSKAQRAIRDAKAQASAAREAARAAQAAEEAESWKNAQKRVERVVAYTPGLSEEYKGKRYVRRDVRVGDTIRVVARVDEWVRRRSEGSQVVRGLWCDESSGGRLEVVHPDEHFNHQSAVRKLHSTLYSSPFVLPKIYFAPPAPPIAAVAPARMSTVSQSPTSAHTSPVRTPTKRRLTGMQPSSPGSPCKRSAPVDLSVSVSYLDSLELDSTVYSEISSFADHALPDVSQLRSSQLSESTYRRYVLDYMIEQVQEAMDTITRQGQAVLDEALNAVFPEYDLDNIDRTYGAAQGKDGSSSTYATQHRSSASYGTPLREIQSGVSSRSHRCEVYDTEDTPKAFRSRGSREAMLYRASSPIPLSPLPSPSMPIPTFTLDALASTPHLASLGGAIADATAKQNERRRRRRIRDGCATDKDRAVERDRLSMGRRADEYHLTRTERRREVLKMTRRAIRSIGEDGGVVQVGTPHPSYTDSAAQYSFARSSISSISNIPSDVAYIPITPPLILPLLMRFMEQEETRRRQVFMRKTDPRYGHGMFISDLAKRLAEWGTEGRWERVGEWSVEDAVLWGVERGRVVRKGNGYWAAAA